jgi:hypothetical protein
MTMSRIKKGHKRSVVEPTEAERKAPKVLRRSIYSDAPPSVVEIAQFTRSGSWVPGLQAEWLETAGKVYGYCIAIPISLALYSVAWLIQRPGRLGLALVLGAVVWFTG